jgi:hypothetical protein
MSSKLDGDTLRAWEVFKQDLWIPFGFQAVFLASMIGYGYSSFPKGSAPFLVGILVYLVGTLSLFSVALKRIDKRSRG